MILFKYASDINFKAVTLLIYRHMILYFIFLNHDRFFFFFVGNALIKCGETQKRIGTADRELIQTSALNFLTPLRNFIEGDYKTIAVSWKIFFLLK